MPNPEPASSTDREVWHVTIFRSLPGGACGSNPIVLESCTPGIVWAPMLLYTLPRSQYENYAFTTELRSSPDDDGVLSDSFPLLRCDSLGLSIWPSQAGRKTGNCAWGTYHRDWMRHRRQFCCDPKRARRYRRTDRDRLFRTNAPQSSRTCPEARMDQCSPIGPGSMERKP